MFTPKGNFTEKEDGVVLKNIAKYPTNLTYSFEMSAKELDRTTKSISARYYNALKHRNKVVSTVGASGVISVNNQKNAVRRPEKVDKLTDLEIEQLVVTLLRKLSPKTRKVVVTGMLVEML